MSRQPSSQSLESSIALFVERFSRSEAKSITFLINSEEVREFLSELDSDHRQLCCKAIFTHMLTRIDDKKAIDKFVHNTLWYLDVICEPALCNIALDLQAQIRSVCPSLQIPSLQEYTINKAELLREWAMRMDKKETGIVPAKPASIQIRNSGEEEHKKICMQLQDAAYLHFSTEVSALKRRLSPIAEFHEMPDSEIGGVPYSTFFEFAQLNLSETEKEFRMSLDIRIKNAAEMGIWKRRKEIKRLEEQARDFYTTLRKNDAVLCEVKTGYEAAVTRFITILLDTIPEVFAAGNRSSAVLAAHSKIDSSSEWTALRSEYRKQWHERAAEMEVPAPAPDFDDDSFYGEGAERFFDDHDDLLR